MESSGKIVHLKKHKGNLKASIAPPSSKSESNRVLIIDALTGGKCTLKNLSSARDTQTMIRLLSSGDKTLDVLDAGTTMRFLTAYTAVSGEEKILTGTQRMKERPIKLLVDALRTLGANIEYLEKEGYPPIRISKFEKEKIATNKLSIPGNISSQYITALLMVAPELPSGLELTLTENISSRPYIEMTLSLMEHFGIKAEWVENTIKVPAGKYIPKEYSVESDWSGASYWYSIVSLAMKAELELKGYKKNSLQGDSIIVDIMSRLGIETNFIGDGMALRKKTSEGFFEQDFTHCPDLAQTIAVACSGKGIPGTLRGLHSLRIKETDRIAALQNELQKFGGDLEEIEPDNIYKVLPGKFSVIGQQVSTYKDHRMAMAFAPLAMLGDLKIENPEVVNKSYPSFWKDLEKVGFVINS